jgi:hypothetical protein
MATSSLMKTILHNSIADGLYNEIISRHARYYYYLGKTLTWENELTPPYPTDSFAAEMDARNEIITMKEIKPTDVAFVIPRYNWVQNSVYDIYDDQYSTEVQGVNLSGGGFGYGSAPNVYIGNQGAINWSALAAYPSGTMIKSGNNHYIVTVSGTLGETAPTHTSGTVTNGTAPLQWVEIDNGNGTGATAEAYVLDGSVIEINLTHRGSGYTSIPSVIISGGGGEAAAANAVVTISPNGFQKLEDALFYVVTDEYNVYKCLDNNNNGASTIKPTTTTVEPVKTSDGYLWKFMYSIPIALRNKFLTDDYMPVITALRDQFYSNGQLQSIRIDQAGSGYTSGTITVQGDGYLPSDPIYLTGLTYVNGGADYANPTVSIDPPFTGVSTWLANQLVLTGQKITYNNNVYKVAISGTTGSIGPTHRFNTVANGTAALEYVGTTATGTAVVDGDGAVTEIILYGMLRDVQVVGGGTGYTSTPVVTVGDQWQAETAYDLNDQVYYANKLYTVSTAGTTGVTPPSHSTGTETDGDAELTYVGSPATAKVVLSVTSIIRTEIVDPGLGYNSAPAIYFGVKWKEGTAVDIGDQIWYSNRLYTVTGAGTTDASSANFPTHLSGSQTNGTATLAYAGVQATALSSIKYGAGYSERPTINISGGAGAGANISFTYSDSNAKLIPVFENGQLTTIQVDDPGQGYTYANLNVVGNGTGAEITADLSPGDVNTLQATVELLTVDGRIMNIQVISGGWGYGAATITITGDGVGATAEAVLVNGAITKINMTSYGSGYRWANVTITGTGWGAKARVVISPYGGHAKEALNNFYARTLMFYSNISKDKNQGFDVNNDYRQLGIIKSPRQYGSTNSLTSISASACWVIAGSINTSLYLPDDIITKAGDNTRFRIVTNTGNAVLVQSIDNGIPVIGSVFSNEAGDVFTAAAVTAPTADKYSGDMLFIDNRAAFTPTADQTVTLRTVIRF